MEEKRQPIQGIKIRPETAIKSEIGVYLESKIYIEFEGSSMEVHNNILKDINELLQRYKKP